MTNRRGLTEQKKGEALALCRNIEHLLKDLLMNTLNGNAFTCDLDVVNRMVRKTQNLRYRIEDYPISEIKKPRI